MATANIPELDRRPLPSFDKWLSDNGDGTRGDGFDGFVDLAKRTHEKLEGFSGDQAGFLRMWAGMQIAVIELCQIERQRGRTPDQIILMMPRVLACAAIYAVASVIKDDAPMRQVAKLLIEEFRFAAKEAADQIEAKR
jgi:hypothetical protein